MTIIMQNRDKIYININKGENVVWEVVYFFRNLFDKSYKDTLIKNNKYKNIHKGKRCFILGNGPSLSKYNNLKLLENEIVFTVNQFYRSELFEIVKPNYHVMVDPLFFSLNPNDPIEYDTLNRMQELQCYSNLTCIFPYTSKEYVEKNGLSHKDVTYIHSRYRMHDNYKKDIRMDRCLPQVQNVVHAAIYCAIFMGFSEIYLMGCDMTGFLTNFIKDEADFDVEKEHVYSYTENEKKRMIKVRNNNNNETMLKAYGVTFAIFRNIYEYCKRKNIQIYNASIGGALDNLPRIKYEEIFRN